jgi:hypothetical protein
MEEYNVGGTKLATPFVPEKNAILATVLSQTIFSLTNFAQKNYDIK